MTTVKFISGLALALAAGVSVPALAQQAAPLKVYAPGEISFDRFEVIDRLWVERFQSAFWIGGHADQPAAFQSLVDAATAAGADGLVNVQCINGGQVLGGESHFCYGNAIRIRSR